MLILYTTVGILSFLALNFPIISSKANVTDKICRKELEEFANAISNFTKCAVNQAAPFKFCRVCYEQYDDLRKVKKTIYQKDGCVSKLVASQRYQIVSRAYDFARSLWDQSNCFNCFTPGHEDEDSFVMKWDMEREVKDFFDKQEIVDNCFKNFTKIHWNPMSNLTNTSMTNQTIDMHSICKLCEPYYRELNDVYKELIDQVGGYTKENSLCADVMSAMNCTRREWSSKFDCLQINYDTASVVALTCFFGLLPVIFYTAAKLHGDSDNKKSSYEVIPQISYDTD